MSGERSLMCLIKRRSEIEAIQWLVGCNEERARELLVNKRSKNFRRTLAETKRIMRETAEREKARERALHKRRLNQ